jgi:hypothetical protein
MRQSQSIVTSRSVTDCAVQWLLSAFAWTSGVRIGAEVLVRLLVRAAAEARSLSALVASAAATPGVETVRRALRGVLPNDPFELLASSSRVLAQGLPRSLRRHPQMLAIDLHLRPYYGRKTTRGTYRSQSKASTKTFFAFATAMIVSPRLPVTIGVVPVVSGEEQTVLLERLLTQVAVAGVRVSRLLLDRGFYAAMTVEWLQERSIRFVMPMIRRGRSGRSQAACTGTEQFFVRGRRGWDRYTWTARPRRAGRKQAALTVTVAVCMASAAHRHRQRRKKGPWVYACHGIQASPQTVVKWYRRRFGIETSYRQLGEGLAATSSTNPTYRLLLVVIALVLRNLWLWLHEEYLVQRAGVANRGRRRRLGLLRFAVLLSWLVSELNRILRFQEVVVSDGEQLSKGG